MATTVIERLVFELGANMHEFNQKMSTASNKLGSFGKRMKSIGSKMSLRLTAPIVGVGAAIFKFSGDFEAAMNGVQAVSGATGEEFDALRSKAKDLGATTKFSATEAAEGIEILARNGLKATDILGGAADASLALAAATGTNLATAGDIATDAMANFNIKASEMSKAVDQISGVTVNSKFSIDDYRLALAQAGGVAGGVGVAFEDFNAALATIAPSFASGSDAGTSFKTFLQRLVPQSKEAAEKMEELGLQFFDGAGNMKSMAEIAQVLQEGFSGLSEAATIDVATTLFGTDALRAALAFAKAGGEGVETVKGLIAETKGADQAKARMQGFGGAMKEMRSALENLAITIADSGLLNFATDMIKSFTELVRKLADTNPLWLKWGAILAGVAAALGPLIIAIGAVAAAIGAISSPILVAIAAVAGLIAIWVKWGDKIKSYILPIIDTLSGAVRKVGSFLGFGGGTSGTGTTTIIPPEQTKIGGSGFQRQASGGTTNVYINEKVSRSDVSGIITEQNRIDYRS